MLKKKKSGIEMCRQWSITPHTILCRLPMNNYVTNFIQIHFIQLDFFRFEGQS